MHVGGLDAPIFPRTEPGISRKGNNFISAQNPKVFVEEFSETSRHLVSVVDKHLVQMPVAYLEGGMGSGPDQDIARAVTVLANPDQTGTHRRDEGGAQGDIIIYARCCPAPYVALKIARPPIPGKPLNRGAKNRIPIRREGVLE